MANSSRSSAISEGDAFRADVAEAKKKIAEKNDTAHITPPIGEFLTQQDQRRIMEREGKYFDCYTRYCPVTKNPDDTYTVDSRQLDEFVAELRKIQKEMEEVNSKAEAAGKTADLDAALKQRDIQLRLNYGEAHWTAINFTVTKDGISATCMDAIQYNTLSEQLASLGVTLNTSNDEVFVVHSTEEKGQQRRPQLYSDCWTQGVIMTESAFHQGSDFIRMIRERALDDKLDAGGLKSDLPTAQFIEWTSMPFQFIRGVQYLNEDQLYHKYLDLNTHNRSELCGSEEFTPENFAAIFETHPRDPNRKYNPYTVTLLKDRVEYAEAQLHTVTSKKDVDPEARKPQSFKGYQLQCTQARKDHLAKVAAAEAVCKAGSGAADEDVARAKAYLEDVKKATSRPVGEELWGHKAVPHRGEKMYDQTYDVVAYVKPDGVIGMEAEVVVYAVILEEIIRKVGEAKEPEMRAALDSSTLADLKKKIEEVKRDYQLDLSKDPQVIKVIKAETEKRLAQMMSQTKTHGVGVAADEVRQYFDFLQGSFSRPLGLTHASVQMRNKVAAKMPKGSLRMQPPFSVPKFHGLRAKLHDMADNIHVDNPTVKALVALGEMAAADVATQARDVFKDFVTELKASENNPIGKPYQMVDEMFAKIRAEIQSLEGQQKNLGLEKRILDAAIAIVDEYRPKIEPVIRQQLEVERRKSEAARSAGSAVPAPPFSGDNRKLAASAAGQPRGEDLTASTDSVESDQTAVFGSASSDSVESDKTAVFGSASSSGSARSGSEEKKSKGFAAAGFSTFGGGAIGNSQAKAKQQQAEKKKQSGGPSLSRSSDGDEG